MSNLASEGFMSVDVFDTDSTRKYYSTFYDEQTKEIISTSEVTTQEVAELLERKYLLHDVIVSAGFEIGVIDEILRSMFFKDASKDDWMQNAIKFISKGDL